MVRGTWTDERLDELSNRVDAGFREVGAEFRAVRGEMGELRAEIGQVREELGGLRGEIKGLSEKMDERFDGLNRTLQIAFGLISVVLVGLMGMIASQL